MPQGLGILEFMLKNKSTMSNLGLLISLLAELNATNERARTDPLLTHASTVSENIRMTITADNGETFPEKKAGNMVFGRESLAAPPSQV